MKLTLTFNTLRLFVMTVAIASACTGLTGCSAVGRCVAEATQALNVRNKEWHDLSRIREDTREELAKQREEVRRLEAERDVQEALLATKRQQLEAEFCRANREALERRAKSNIRETVESKVAFNVQQGLEVGELEVDTEALKKLLEKREKEPLEKPEPETEPLKKQPCQSCDQPCGCAPRLLRRDCLRCRNRPCEAEKTCGGPEALTRAEQQPLRKPLRPAEIPLKLPVRLTFGMQQPETEAVRIRKEAPPEALQKQENLERPPCHHRLPPCNEKGCPTDAQSPPVPTADDPPAPVVDNNVSARRLPSTSIQGNQLERVPIAVDSFSWQPVVTGPLPPYGLPPQ